MMHEGVATGQMYTVTISVKLSTNNFANCSFQLLKWVFGMNPAIPAFSLQDQDQNQLVVLYAGAHVGIIYNHTLNSQYMLQVHKQ